MATITPALNKKGNDAFQKAARKAIENGVPSSRAWRGGVGTRAKALVINDGLTVTKAVNQAVKEAVDTGWPTVHKIAVELAEYDFGVGRCNMLVRDLLDLATSKQ